MTKALAIMRAAYPRNYGVKSEADADLVINVWFFHFGVLPFEIFMQAMNQHIINSPYEPKICDIYKLLTALTFNVRDLIKANTADDSGEYYDLLVDISEEDINECKELAPAEKINVEEYKQLYELLASIVNKQNNNFEFGEL